MDFYETGDALFEGGKNVQVDLSNYKELQIKGRFKIQLQHVRSKGVFPAR